MLEKLNWFHLTGLIDNTGAIDVKTDPLMGLFLRKNHLYIAGVDLYC